MNAVVDQVDLSDRGSAAPESRNLDVNVILPSPYQTRKRFDPVTLAELADSIRSIGVMQPAVVRPHPTIEGMFELIAGERRLRATKIAGLAEIPVRILYVDDLTAFEMTTIENMQREDLHPLEEAEGYEALMQAHGAASGYSVDQVAAKLGKSRAYVYGRMKLCALSPESRKAFYDEKLTASTALLLARLPNLDMQNKALGEITRAQWSSQSPLSFREAADHIKRNYMLRLDQAKFPITDATLVPSAGSCRECPKRTGANPDLFSDVGSADVCTDPTCHSDKVEAHADRIRQAAIATGKTIIAGADAVKIVPYANATRLQGYVRLDDRCDAAPPRPVQPSDSAEIDEMREEHEEDYEPADDYDDTVDDDEADVPAPAFEVPTVMKPRYRELLAEVMEKTVTIIDPHSGLAFEAIPAAVAHEALQAHGVDDYWTRTSRSTADARVDNKDKRAKERLEIAYRKRLIDDVRVAIRAGEPAADSDGTKRRNHTDILAATLFDRSHPRTKKALCGAFSWDIAPYGHVDIADARKQFAALDTDEMAEALILLIVLPAIDIDEYRKPSEVELVDIAESLGINPKAVKKEVTAAAKAKVKPAKKAAPAKADKNTPADPAEPKTVAKTPALVEHPTESGVPFSVGDRVKVKDDAQDGRKKPLAVCGRTGRVESVLHQAKRVHVSFTDGTPRTWVNYANLETGTSQAASLPSSESQPVERTLSQTTARVLDRVQVKEGRKGPGGKFLKVCGRVGHIEGFKGSSVQVLFDDGTRHANLKIDDLQYAPELVPAAAIDESSEEPA